MVITTDKKTVSKRKKAERVIAWLMSLLSNSHPLCAAYSGGKDSSAVLVLMLEAIRRYKERGITIPRCYVTNSDDYFVIRLLDNWPRQATEICKLKTPRVLYRLESESSRKTSQEDNFRI